MKKTFKGVFAAMLLVLTLAATAQEKLFTPGDYMNWELYPESMNNLIWKAGSERFTYVHDNTLVQKHAAEPENTDTLLRLTDLNRLMKKLGEDELWRFPRIKWLDNDRFYYLNDRKVMVFDFADSTLAAKNIYPEKAENIEMDKTSLAIAYTLDNNLYIVIDGKTMAVTEEENSDILYGHVPSRNEFGIHQGSFWSPGGKRLAFYRTDQTEVESYPNVDLYHHIAKHDPIKYPMAGKKSQKVKLGIFDPALNEITFIRTPGPENQYITSVTWGPDGDFIYAGILNRDQNHLDVNKYDAKSGKFIKTLFTETNERYVEPMHGLHFMEQSPERFIWQSRRDGWNHLYLYDTDGNLISQITKGEWEVTDFLGTDPDEKHVFYMSTTASPIERQLYKTDLKKGKTQIITVQKGSHSIQASASKNYFLDNFSSTTMAGAAYLIDQNGENLFTLLEDENPWEDYKTGEMEIFSIKADDGETDLYCRLIKPVDFDPEKKYPVLVYVYGGPHAQLIMDTWTGGAGFWLNYMAQQGYVVFTLDNRGSANRGFEFESIIHRQVGEKEMADQMAGVAYLKSLDYVDHDRIGVDGWSYGGFLTTSLMLRNPGVFRVGCAGGPVIDWKWYEVMYGERYMDTPMQNPEGYEKAKVLNYVDQLEGKLLIIHGTNDPVVMWQNSLIFIDECIKQGKQVDYFVYPGAAHNTRGKARVHMFEKITGYFNDHLK